MALVVSGLGAGTTDALAADGLAAADGLGALADATDGPAGAAEVLAGGAGAPDGLAAGLDWQAETINMARTTTCRKG